jgi:hypothetical protein
MDLTSECEELSFLDAYSGYHQIPLTKEDQPTTKFITPFGYFCYIKIPFRLKNVGPPSSVACNPISRNKSSAI